MIHNLNLHNKHVYFKVRGCVNSAKYYILDIDII